MSPKMHKLDRHSVKSLLKNTLLQTIENIATHLSNFLETKEPESLHQYRVSVRMARSVCLEFSEFMEEKRKFTLEKILKSLQKETNEMRDIDVFLECIEAYNAFEAKYTQAFKDEMIARLQAIQNDEKLCLPKSEEKIYKYIKEILTKRLKKIAKTSKKLSLDAPNERFHKLRLHYKKLRYNADAIKLTQFSKSFKPLQNAFGKVQDKNTQIERIKRYNTSQSSCLESIIALLEQELIADKQACIEKSSKENIVKMREHLDTIFP